jgi:hypothetical protein
MTNRRIIWIITLLIAGGVTHAVRGDGGTVRFNETVDGITITIFTAPASLHVGPIDVSVMVTDAATRSPILDAHVSVTAQRHGGGSFPLTVAATHEAATNKLLYEAVIAIPLEGTWETFIEVHLDDDIHTASCSFLVSPPLGAWIDHWPWLVAPLIVIAAMMAVGVPRSGGSHSGDSRSGDSLGIL